MIRYRKLKSFLSHVLVASCLFWNCSLSIVTLAIPLALFSQNPSLTLVHTHMHTHIRSHYSKASENF